MKIPTFLQNIPNVYLMQIYGHRKKKDDLDVNFLLLLTTSKHTVL